jgi:hypothetical protein
VSVENCSTSEEAATGPGAWKLMIKDADGAGGGKGKRKSGEQTRVAEEREGGPLKSDYESASNKKRQRVPAPSLEHFKRTSAFPPIYWKTVSEEEIQQRRLLQNQRN